MTPHYLICSLPFEAEGNILELLMITRLVIAAWACLIHPSALLYSVMCLSLPLHPSVSHAPVLFLFLWQTLVSFLALCCLLRQRLLRQHTLLWFGTAVRSAFMKPESVVQVGRSLAPGLLFLSPPCVWMIRCRLFTRDTVIRTLRGNECSVVSLFIVSNTKQFTNNYSQDKISVT